MRILLDSHIFVWVKSAPENLSHEARAAIIDPANDVYISVASVWELWLKHAKKPIVAVAPVLNGGAAACPSRSVRPNAHRAGNRGTPYGSDGRSCVSPIQATPRFWGIKCYGAP